MNVQYCTVWCTHLQGYNYDALAGMMFSMGPHPTQLDCPFCGHHVITLTNHVSGACVGLVCTLLLSFIVYDTALHTSQSNIYCTRIGHTPFCPRRHSIALFKCAVLYFRLIWCDPSTSSRTLRAERSKSRGCRSCSTRWRTWSTAARTVGVSWECPAPRASRCLNYKRVLLHSLPGRSALYSSKE